MQSQSLCIRNLNHTGFIAPSFSRLGHVALRLSFDRRNTNRRSSSVIDRRLSESRARPHGFRVRHGVFRLCAMDDDSFYDDWGDNSLPVGFMYSSSDSEVSDGEITLQPITDIDLPTSRDHFRPSDDSITVTAHRLATLSRTRTSRKTLYGVLNNVGLLSFSTFLVLLVDQCAWRIVRLPLAPFHLMRPFMTSVISAACVGYICVPLFRMLKLRSTVRKEAPPTRHSSKKGTPTMGGLYFVPIGIIVSEFVLRFSSVEVSGAAIVTIAFAAIGLLNDYLSIKNKNDGLSGWVRVLLEVIVGVCFSYWMYRTDITTPYSIKMVVPLPSPLGLVCAGKLYPVLTLFSFVSMANVINLTDGPDGLAAGAAALAFIAMSIVVLPICSDISIFGASMAGACVGFLFQNRYKASIFMGDTGALGLGGALAAMASCTGMFFPLFISSGIFFLVAVLVIMQVSLFKANKYFRLRRAYSMFRMAALHYYLDLCGIREPTVVAVSYAIASLLSLCGAYVGLTSA